MEQIAEAGEVERRFAADDWTARVAAVGEAGDLLVDHFEGPTYERLLALVERASRDEKWEVRKASARVLGRVRDRRAPAILARLATDPNRWVQQAARHRLDTGGGAPPDATLDELVSVIQKVKPKRMSRDDLLQFARFSGDLHYEDLASETAHELRTVGTALEGCVAALEDRLREVGRGDEIVSGLAGKLRERGRFLARLVDDLCAYTAAPGRFGPVNVRHAALTALDLARARIGPVRLPPRLEPVIEVAEGLVVEGVQDRLTRAFANVLANGIEAIEVEGEIRLQAAPAASSGMVVVRVMDTGTGMDANQIRDAFRRYATSKRARGGTGLGLPIVKRIVEREHRGRMRIESAPGRGTTVFMEIPIRQEQHAHGPA